MGIAIVGLSAVAAALGPMFQFVKYAGAAYLIWLGCRMLLTAAQPIAVPRTATGAFWRDAGLGLLVTLGNPKPILFYGAIVPALFDVRAIGGAGFVLLAVIVAAISYAVYGLYIAAARRTRRLVASTRTVRRLNQATGTLLIGTGLAAAAR